MISYIKKGPTQEEKVESNKKVQVIVEDIIADIESNGDQAVQNYSKKLSRKMTQFVKTRTISHAADAISHADGRPAWNNSWFSLRCAHSATQWLRR